MNRIPDIAKIYLREWLGNQTNLLAGYAFYQNMLSIFGTCMGSFRLYSQELHWSNYSTAKTVVMLFDPSDCMTYLIPRDAVECQNLAPTLDDNSKSVAFVTVLWLASLNAAMKIESDNYLEKEEKKNVWNSWITSKSWPMCNKLLLL